MIHGVTERKRKRKRAFSTLSFSLFLCGCGDSVTYRGEGIERGISCHGESSPRGESKNPVAERAKSRRSQTHLCRVPQRHLRADGRREGGARKSHARALLHARG